MVLWFCKRPGLYYIGGSDVLPPPLKGEEEKKALAALEQGDEEARQLLVEHNLRLVVYIARRFENVSTGLEDLISIGTIGLIKAIGTYRLDKNIRLATYASRCIENEILMHIRKISGMKEIRLKVFDKLFESGYDSDDKISKLNIEELLLNESFTRSDLEIALGIKEACIKKCILAFLNGVGGNK